MWMGETRLAADELMRAAETVQGHDEAIAARLLHEAVMPIALTGDVNRCFQAATRSEALVPGEFASFHGRVMIAAAYLLHGATEQARGRLELAERLRPDVDPVSEQHALAIMAQLHWWIEDFPAAKRLITIDHRTAAPARRVGGARLRPDDQERRGIPYRPLVIGLRRRRGGAGVGR